MNELEDSKLAELYRASAREMPAASTDALLQAAARRAVGARPQARPGTQRPRWFVPLLAAATLAAIAVGIVRVMEPDEIAAPRPDIAPAAKEDARDALAPPAAPKPQNAVPAVQPEPPAPAAKVKKSEPAQAFKPERKREAPRASDQGAGFVPSPPAQPGAPAAAAAPPESRMAAPMRAEQAAPPRPAAPSSGDYAAGAATGSVAPPAGAPAVRSPAAEQQLKSLQLDRQVENRAAPAPSAARPPEEWLQAIRRLLDSGRMEEATRELREFRRAYPQFELPADMRQLVR